jgi:hypothetical protein
VKELGAMEQSLASYTGRLEALRPDYERFKEREEQGDAVKILKMKR